MLKIPIANFLPGETCSDLSSEEFDTCPTNNLVVNAGDLAGRDGGGDFRRGRTQPSLRRLIKIRVNRSAKTLATVRSALVPGFNPEDFSFRSKVRRS
jgi:hypothetical protein